MAKFSRLCEKRVNNFHCHSTSESMKKVNDNLLSEYKSSEVHVGKKKGTAYIAGDSND